MTDSRYKRVSRKLPCLICGKPDLCSRAADDSVPFYARVCEGADRLSRRESWGGFYHNRKLLNKPFWKAGEPRNLLKGETQKIHLAPPEIRDFVYSSLLRLPPASNYDCLATGRKGLRERGLENFEDYGALPCTAADRKDSAAKVRRLLNQNFPAFVRENLHGIRRVPGFWVNISGEINLWQKHDYTPPRLLIPYATQLTVFKPGRYALRTR